jgi:hypothetical protein
MNTVATYSEQARFIGIWMKPHTILYIKQYGCLLLSILALGGIFPGFVLGTELAEGFGLPWIAVVPPSLGLAIGWWAGDKAEGHGKVLDEMEAGLADTMPMSY